ncbi:MAG TPA: RNA-binding protein [Nitrososphaeraceae archaeon]|jgi:translin|nr:RNA-binding protein [Nitrososphaeraceae archaeon]
MLPSNIQKSLDQINEDLKNVEERREILIKGSRDVVMFCSKSIIALHRNEIEEAQNKMNQAKIMLDESRQYAKTDLNRYIIVAEQELVEAYALKSVVQDSPLPDVNELNVSGSSYITGLLDCIGEIKRMVYDRMRLGRAEDAARLFATMQDIYGAVYPFAVYDNLVSGIRRKLDVAKMLIEDIRAVVTEETRRSIMIKAIDSLERKLQ